MKDIMYDRANAIVRQPCVKVGQTRRDMMRRRVCLKLILCIAIDAI